MLRYGVLFSLSLCLFRFFLLVFHLKQKHEEGQRLLHYLQQTNTALATGTFIYLINQEACGKEIKYLQSCVFTEDNVRIRIVATGLETVCNYGY